MEDKNSYSTIGIMSGTSLDGLDIAWCNFEKKNGLWKYELLKSTCIQYTDFLESRLRNSHTFNAIELLKFNNDYGHWLGCQVDDFINEYQAKVDFVCSHGHTIYHQPLDNITYQLGAGQMIANACQHIVISDFRSKDVSLGGQGAPLVPIGDHLLFNEFDYCINLGGIANISFVQENQRLAYDVTPVNMVLNHYSQKMGYLFDDNGKIASNGQLIPELLKQLNELPYYKLSGPKSLGVEDFIKSYEPIIEHYADTIPDILFTYTEHAAQQIANQLNGPSDKSVLITGGGSKNGFLMEAIQSYCNDSVKLSIPTQELVDYKEALIFGFMGVLRWRNEINSLQSVTGAISDSSGGIIYHP